MATIVQCAHCGREIHLVRLWNGTDVGRDGVERPAMRWLPISTRVPTEFSACPADRHHWRYCEPAAA